MNEAKVTYKKQNEERKMKCPFVVDPNEIERNFNKPIHYKTDDGEEYIFFDHTSSDGFGTVTRVQFCELIGRKTDVFQCLNENEWKRCRYYQHEMTWREEQETRRKEKEAKEMKEEK